VQVLLTVSLLNIPMFGAITFTVDLDHFSKTATSYDDAMKVVE